MTTLPPERRAIAGRTWPAPWSASSMDPIRHYRATWRYGDLARAVVLVAACILIGLMLAGRSF